MKTSKVLAILFFVAAVVASKPSDSLADARVVPGAEIALDVSKIAGPEAVSQIVNQCMYEQTMKSLLPSAWGAQTSSDTVVTITGYASFDQDRSGSSKTPFSLALPKFESKTGYVEWTNPTTSVKHVADFEVKTSGYFANADTGLAVQLHTDAEGPMMDIQLQMLQYFPRVEFKGVSSETCANNNWGRSICTPSGSLTDVKIVIPQNFVAKNVWQNYDTGTATKKTFDFDDYADCLLYKFENP